MSVIGHPARTRPPVSLDFWIGAWAFIITLAFVWVILSWASGGAASVGEHNARVAAEGTAIAQATRIAQLIPTRTPCPYGTYGSC